MALYKTITVDDSTKVLIWRVEETEEELRKNIRITAACEERMNHMKSEIHRRGFLSIRQLLKAAGYTTDQLYYDSLGKPHLNDDAYISITHSFAYSGIIISSRPVGIDIEKQRPKISLIAHKFINYEFSYIPQQDIKRLTIAWCIKESLYKVFATKGLSFKDHIKIVPFDQAAGKAVSWVQYEQTMRRYHLSFLEFDGFTCAFALDNNLN